MLNLDTQKKWQERQDELNSQYRYYLYQKGYPKATFGITDKEVAKKLEFTKEKAEETAKKYNLTSTISDMDLGMLEGKVYATMINAGIFGVYSGDERLDWLKSEIERNKQKIYFFLMKCVAKKPNISKSPIDSDFKLKADAEFTSSFWNEVIRWNLTPREFGNLCGYVSAMYLAIGEEWTFNEQDFEVPIDCKRFYKYIESRAAKLRKKNMIEMPIIFQMALGM